MTERDALFASGDGHFLVRSHLAGRRVRFLIGLVLIVLIAAAAFFVLGVARRSGETHPVEAKYVWVQVLPDRGGESGGRLVRAIVPEGDRCPRVTLGSGHVDMVRRPPRVASAYPILLCQAELDDASEAWIGSRRLPARPTEPSDIVAIGDTGCRLVHYGKPQLCNSGVDWPFGAVAVHAAGAAMAAGARPIIIHVGDFHYREKPCADADPGCSGSPFGDNWATWEAEFFKPASPLLLTAPWIVLRGNHENCERAGAGWLFFFELSTPNYEGVCADDRPPYMIGIGRAADNKRRELVVFDTANEADEYSIKHHCETYQKWLDGVDRNKTELWLALHQPLWFRGTEEAKRVPEASTKPVPCQEEKTQSTIDVLRIALFDGRPDIKLILSGDVHLFEVFTPDKPEVPIQIVAGNGGTKLDPIEKRAPGDSTPVPDNVVSQAFTSFGVPGAITAFSRFGFVVLHRDANQWTARMHDKEGHLVVTCPIPDTREPRDGKPNCTSQP